MKPYFSIVDRKPIWMALSAFYLDTELSEKCLIETAALFKKSPYSFEEIKTINKYEVYPILYQNLLSMYGFWSGFNEAWLFESITSRINKKSFFKKIILEIKYFTFNGNTIVDWEKLENL